jgi:hypothetical protein
MTIRTKCALIGPTGKKMKTVWKGLVEIPTPNFTANYSVVAEMKRIDRQL